MFKLYAIQAHLRLLLETEPFTLTRLCCQVIKSLNEPKATAPSPTPQPPRFPKHHYSTSQTTRGEAASPRPAQAYLPLHRKERCHLQTQLRGKKKNQQVKRASTKPPKPHHLYSAEMPLVLAQLPAHHQQPQASIQRQGRAPQQALAPPGGSNPWQESQNQQNPKKNALPELPSVHQPRSSGHLAPKCC